VIFIDGFFSFLNLDEHKTIILKNYFTFLKK
jgi:hypothetical protein